MSIFAQILGKILIKKKLTLSICESCTGGMLGSIITGVPGSSKYFKGGVIAYSNDIKKRVIGIKEQTLKKFGAVSNQTAREMAKGVRRITNSDIGISITGIAGPGGGSKIKPVGLVFIALATRNKLLVFKFNFKGNREQIRKKASAKALRLAINFMKEIK